MDFISTARSNYFKVKDIKKFAKFILGLNMYVMIQDTKLREAVYANPKKLYTLPKNTLVGFKNEDGGINTYDNDTEDDIDFNLMLSNHLQKGQVAIYQEVGSEGMRYLVGSSTAVNSEGRIKYVDLSEIYDLAKKLSPKGKMTTCEY